MTTPEYRAEMDGRTDRGDSGRLGALLRFWRGARSRSQLDLSAAAGVSQRHISFIESGRSTPGRGTLLALAEALDVPLRDRNALLLAAGYAPAYPEHDWDGPQMRSITRAVERTLAQQEPFPALLMDRYWNVLATNAAAPRFFGMFVDLAQRTGPRNMLRLVFDPAGLRPFIRDWDRVARSLIGRVHREAAGRVADEGTRRLLDELAALAGGAPGRAQDTGAADLPMVPLVFEKDGMALSYFSLVCTVGAPTTVTAQELRIECMFPADAATEERHLALMGGALMGGALMGGSAR